MRIILFIISLLIGSGPIIFAQGTNNSEEVFLVAEDAPRFPGCEEEEMEYTQRTRCANQRMLEFVYQHIKYPETARQNGVEGTVVVRFIVEKDGRITDTQAIKDIGEGCGDEAIRVIQLMNEMALIWKPGRMKSENVRTYVNLPVKFKIEKAPEYYVDGRDTVWVIYDTPPVFEGGIETLDQFLKDQLVYPKEGNDSCMIGVMDCSTLVRENGQVVVLDVKDYNNLGLDYQFAATRTIIRSTSKWQPAIYQGRNVTTGYDIRLTLSPTSEACKERITQFEQSYEKALDGIRLTEEDKKEEAVIAYTEALNLFPENAEFLLWRGQTLFELDRVEEACEDLKEVSRRLIKNVYSNLLPVICPEKEKEETEEEK